MEKFLKFINMSNRLQNEAGGDDGGSSGEENQETLVNQEKPVNEKPPVKSAEELQALVLKLEQEKQDLIKKNKEVIEEKQRKAKEIAEKAKQENNYETLYKLEQETRQETENKLKQLNDQINQEKMKADAEVLNKAKEKFIKEVLFKDTKVVDYDDLMLHISAKHQDKLIFDSKEKKFNDLAAKKLFESVVKEKPHYFQDKVEIDSSGSPSRTAPTSKGALDSIREQIKKGLNS